MDRMKIDNLTGSSYTGSRYIYGDFKHGDKTQETVDLLQMVPGNAPEQIKPSSTETSLDENKSRDRENEYNMSCSQRYYSTLPSNDVTSALSHLCPKHAFQVEHTGTPSAIYEQRNNIYSQGESVYERTNLKNSRAIEQAQGRADYFNYLKQFKRNAEKTQSTQSLPAVTYTMSKNKQNRTFLFRKPRSLFKKTDTELNAHFAEGSFRKAHVTSHNGQSHCGIKRLLLLVCILFGVVLALGGIAIGFFVLPFHMTHKACEDGYFYCTGTGCVTVTYLCSNNDVTCPEYSAQTVCKLQRVAANDSRFEDIATTEMTRFHPRPSVTSQLIYDENGWVHYYNATGVTSMYKILSQFQTFQNAQDACAKYGGHLVHVNSVREQVFIEDYMNDQLTMTSVDQYTLESSLGPGTRGVWLGGRRAPDTNPRHCLEYKQWLWTDSAGKTLGVIDGFADFGPGKPDNHYNPEECLYIRTRKRDPEPDYSFLKWDDAPCNMDGLGLKPLCEIDIPSTLKYLQS